MSSSTPGRPGTGRPSPAVYRRRRLVALLLLLLVVAAVAWGVSALLSRGTAADAAPDEASAAAAGEAAEQDPGTEEPAPTGEVLSCTAADLDSDVALDPAAPAAGSGVRLQITLHNSGEQPCLVDAGLASLVASVGSGSDSVWSSAHCADDTTNELLLDTGAETSVTARWDGHRSAEGCPGDQPQAGAGTYRVSLALGGETLEPRTGRVFTLG